MPKLKGYTTFTHPETGVSETVSPDDKLPEWVSEKDLPKHLLEDPKADETADVVAGPGLTAEETAAAMSEDEKAEARKEADRVRKANARAAAKREKEQADAVEAAQKAELERQAAEDAAALGQGGS